MPTVCLKRFLRFNTTDNAVFPVSYTHLDVYKRQVKKYIADNNIQFYTIDGVKIGKEIGLGNRINTDVYKRQLYFRKELS